MRVHLTADIGQYRTARARASCARCARRIEPFMADHPKAGQLCSRCYGAEICDFLAINTRRRGPQ